MRQILAAAYGLRPYQIGTHLPAMHEKPILEVPVEHNNETVYFYKSHAENEQFSFEGKKIVNDHIIYMIRHPLDVFMSFVNYLSKNVTSDAKAVGIHFDYSSADALKNSKQLDLLLGAFCVFGTLQPHSRGFGSWFSNAEHFVRAAETDDRIIIVRYEDLIWKFNPTVEALLSKIGNLDVDLDMIQSQADQATSKNGKFFWKRKSGNFRDYLTREQIDLFFDVHKDRCHFLGYTNQDD